MEVGTGVGDFEAIQDEQLLELVAGPQGGFHFIVHARGMGLDPGDVETPGDPGNPTTVFAAFDESGLQIDRQLPAYHLGYEAAASGGGWYELSSGRILQIENQHAPAVIGQRVRLRVSVEDADGKRGTDEVWIRAFDAFAPDGGP